MNIIRIEKAGLKAWPAFEEFDDNGWISRFADGYTKRANSITVLTPGTDSLKSLIQQYEHLYNSKKQPCIFRLLSFNDNTEIERILDARGYTKDDHSLVLSLELKNREFQSLEFDPVTVPEWMKYFCELSGKEIKSHSTHIKIINNIKARHILASLSVENAIISCGLGVLSDGLFGLFDIVTHPQHRNKGYGYKLISGMLQWAFENGASSSYIQVIAENKSAIGLYKRLGYETAYEYHYRIQNYQVPLVIIENHEFKGSL
ncbi:MAG: GNAT family N-acetyltransferase [Desulfatiglans sp.]|jgi:RimJ/RimL family protein N-acetyltransferase|nr:GNAT family N-acetyltransferase [Desulfatiglans sp.]